MPTSEDRPDRRAVRAKIAAQQAAARRAERRRRLLTIAGAVVAVGGIIAAIVLNLPSHSTSTPSSTPSASSSGLGPEGMALENGPVLASAGSAATGQSVDGISCQASEQVAYHIHTHLAVYINGQLRPIPYGIGTVTPVPQTTNQGVFASASRCYYWLHTHAQDGVIHIESPTQAQYTLGQFFDL